MLCVGFAGLRGSLNPDDPIELSRAVAQLMPDARVVDVTWHDWSADPFSGATSFRPRLQRAMRKRTGNVFFAGSDLATAWPAWMAGAVESGTATAAAVLETLKQKERYIKQ
jgi:monoamine oxidase